MTKASTRSGRRTKRSDIDWALIERLYVEGEYLSGEGATSERVMPSYADLGRRFSLRTASVADRGRIGQWPRKREEFARSLNVVAYQKRIETVSSALADATRKTLDVGNRLVAELEAFILRMCSPDATGKVEGLDADDFSKLSSALKRLVETRRIELGLEPPERGREAVVSDDPFVQQATRAAVLRLLEENATPGSTHDTES